MTHYNSINRKAATDSREVSKSEPCPICKKEDWCFLLSSQIVICNRTNPGTRVDGWIEFAKDKNGAPIYKEEEAYNEYRQNLKKNSGGKPHGSPNHVHPRVPEVTKPWDLPDLRKIRNDKIKTAIAEFRFIPRDIASSLRTFNPQFPIWSAEAPQWKFCQSENSDSEMEIHYPYSESQEVIRRQWSDRRAVYRPKNKPKSSAKTKLIYAQNRKTKWGNFDTGKGDRPWGVYREQEAIQELPQAGGVLWLVGGESTCDAARALGLVAVSTQGGEGKNLPDLIRFIGSARNPLGESLVKALFVVPDYDLPGIQATSRTLDMIRESFPTLPSYPIDPSAFWQTIPEKGDIADWVTSLYLEIQQDSKLQSIPDGELVMTINSGSQDKIQKSLQTIIAQSTNSPYQAEAISDTTNQKQDSGIPLSVEASAEEMISKFSQEFKNRFVYCLEEKTWYEYESLSPGCWSPVGKVPFRHKLVQAVKNCGIYPNYRRIDTVEKELCGYLYVRFDSLDNLDPNIIPMQNGIFDLTTQKLLPHCPENLITNTIPYPYTPEATCPNISQWLRQMTGGAIIKQNILLAFAAASLRKLGRVQRYLELTGAPGCGKGTWLRLMTAFLDKSNTVATTLKHLEGQFELHRFKKAKLIQISDAHEFAGDPAILKMITGADSLRTEYKNSNYAGEDYYYEGVVVICANNTPRFSSGQEALNRRRVPVILTNPVDSSDAEDLIEPQGSKWIGKFADELPGFFNLVASIPEDEIFNVLRDRDRIYQTFQSAQYEILLDTDPLSQWVDECLWHDPEIDEKNGLPKLKTKVGTAEKDSSGNFINFDQCLYANYRQWLIENGHTRFISTRRFSSQLQSLLQRTLKIPATHAFQHRIAEGSHFFGIGLRSQLPNTESAPLIISEPEPRNQITESSPISILLPEYIEPAKSTEDTEGTEGTENTESSPEASVFNPVKLEVSSRIEMDGSAQNVKKPDFTPSSSIPSLDQELELELSKKRC